MMTIGDGLFLSSLFLGLVLLYIFTRDRWKWKKIVVRFIGVVFGLVLVIGVGTYVYLQYEKRPQVATSLWDVPISSSPSDVKFKKGEPTEIDSDVSAPRWTYKLEHVAYHVDFKENKVSRVLAVGDRLYLPSAAGVSPYGTSLDEITDKLGPPSYISRAKNDLIRAYSFAKYNVAFGIERGDIRMVAVGVTEESPWRFRDEAP